MRYSDNSEVRLGDEIEIANGERAIVVFISDSLKVNEQYPKSDWQSVKDAILVETQSGAVVEFDYENIHLIHKLHD